MVISLLVIVYRYEMGGESGEDCLIIMNHQTRPMGALDTETLITWGQVVWITSCMYLNVTSPSPLETLRLKALRVCGLTRGGRNVTAFFVLM